MARVPNTPRVQKQAIKENRKRAIAGVKSTAMTKGLVGAKAAAGSKVGGSKEMRNRLSYKTAVASVRADSAGVSPKKVARVAARAEQKGYTKGVNKIVKTQKV
jgi:hypothetical protein